MPVRIRLQRFGKKGRPFYHIVVADGRAPRDGKSIDKIGSYDPLTQPATIELDINKAVKWLENGASPSDTAKAILSYKGAMYKYHLLKGVKKGALTEEQAEAKFNLWLDEKQAKIISKIKEKELAKKDVKKKLIEQEKAVNEARENKQREKLAKLVEKEEAADTNEVAQEEPAEVTENVQAQMVEETPQAVVAEETTVEEAPAEETKEPVNEAIVEEAPAEETKEPVNEATVEEASAEETKEPVNEATVEETPAEETKEPVNEATVEETPAEETKEPVNEAIAEENTEEKEENK